MAEQTEIQRLECELEEIREAIRGIRRRGQSVTVNGRTLSRADLRWLREDEQRIEQKLARSRRGGIPMRQAVPRG